jgi:carbonic anhydrase
MTDDLIRSPPARTTSVAADPSLISVTLPNRSDMKFDITYRYEARERPARPQPNDSGAALCRLCDGNRAFAALFDTSSKGADRAEMIVELDPRDVGLSTGAREAARQRPFAAVLGCADARVPIEMIFSEGPNDLFVLRVVGNGLGADVLGSLNYARDHLGDSLRLIVVLGHSGCGAVSSAVDIFLQPAKYLPLATQHSLRGIVDHLMGVVQASAKRLLTAFGSDVVDHPNYRHALVEASIATNAALTAYSIEKEFGPADRGRLRAVYGVYLLETRRIWVPAETDAGSFGLAAPPSEPAKFDEFSDAIIGSDRILTLLRTKIS